MATPSLEKRSMQVCGHRSSVALEPEFWRVLERAASLRGVSLTKLVGQIETDKPNPEQSLASACRCFALAFVIGQRSAA